MSNLTDALIAAKLVGGSGGSGGGSGLPEIRIVSQPIYETQTVSGFYEQGGLYGVELSDVDLSPITNEMPVTVSFDGVDYPVNALAQGGKVAMGNGGLVGGTDTGEPFYITNRFSYPLVTIVTSQSGTSHIIGISANLQAPADDSMLVVENGAWVTELVKDVLPLAVARIALSGDITVEANSSNFVSGLTITAAGSIPTAWQRCQMGMTTVEDGDQVMTEVFAKSANLNLTNHTASVSFYNPTSQAVTFSGCYISGLALKLS